MNNVWVIARNTFGDALRKRVLLIFLLLAFVSLVLALMLNYFTAREQATVFKSTQLVIILIFGALISITTSVFLIPNEIERRTIYSVLAKPIQRWEFFFGKFLGGALTVGFMVGLMSIVLMIVLFVLAARPPQGSAEQMLTQASQGVNVKEWMLRGFGEMILVARATIVIYFQLVIVTAIATTLSLFLTPTVNFSITAFIWIVGSLQWLVSALANRNEQSMVVTSLLSKGIYYALPHFHDFNIMGSIVHPEVPIAVNHWVYAAQVSVYGMLYGALWLLVGIHVFDRKEV
ncbi:MAG: ABC transporter permease [Armatimonadota bacterium]